MFLLISLLPRQKYYFFLTCANISSFFTKNQQKICLFQIFLLPLHPKHKITITTMRKFFLLCALCATSFSLSFAQTSYDLWICGVRITSDNCSDISAINGMQSASVYFYPDKNKLVLFYGTITPPTGAYAIQSAIPNLQISVSNNFYINGYENWSAIRLENVS